jgi:hypothetical protein
MGLWMANLKNNNEIPRLERLMKKALVPNGVVQDVLDSFLFAVDEVENGFHITNKKVFN